MRTQRVLLPRKETQMNYNEFDPFLRVDTWHTGHHYDEQRFYRCLAQVVEDPGFSPESMGNYMREAKKIAPDDHDHPFAMTIRELVTKAWAVREFLQAKKEMA
jgi:hypothetical protein